MSRSMSPGGALLRASRVFSIPAPLPRAADELSTKGFLNSNTATLPYPVQLSITTPPSSRAKGDWGFKRSLPLRSTTKTSTPFIRVDAIDTFEHVTEYASSADHALSLQKWQEMGVPLTVPVIKNTLTYQHDERKSVFEDDMDTTVEQSRDSRKEDIRWNFKGPWLAGMTQGDFDAYLSRQIKDKKSEFRKYLRQNCASALTVEARRQAVDEEKEEVPVAIQPEQVTEEQMTEYLKVLRYKRTELYRLIRSFLDLPPPPSITGQAIHALVGSILDAGPPNSEVVENTPDSLSPYAKSGPPATHPSAGLSYSLTNAHVYNHPKFGPQQKPAPVKARVVLPKNAGVGNFQPALGVGGFVTSVPSGEAGGYKASPRMAARGFSGIPGVDRIDPDTYGGSKLYVEPTHAEIDPSGKVVLSVNAADMEAVAVHEGTADKLQPKTTTTGTFGSTRPGWKPIPGLQAAATAGNDFAMGYGLSSRSTAPEDVAARRARQGEEPKQKSSRSLFFE